VWGYGGDTPARRSIAVKLGQAGRPHDVVVFVARVWSDSGEWDGIGGQGLLAGKGNRQG